MRQSKIRRDDGIAVACEVGASAALDRIAAEAVGVHGFLRAAWFEAGAFDAPIETLAAYRADGTPLVALPLVARRHGFLDLKEVPGRSWP